MNKKNVWTAIATILLPYLMLLALALIFLSTKLAFFEWIMQFVFWNNALLLILALLFCCIFVAILNVLCFIANIRQKEDALALAKTAMIVKLTQIPAYVLIFVLGVLLLLTIFTIPFTIALFSLIARVCSCQAFGWLPLPSMQSDKAFASLKKPFGRSYYNSFSVPT